MIKKITYPDKELEKILHKSKSWKEALRKAYLLGKKELFG